MSLTWTDPAALWLLVLVPLVWAGHLLARTNFNRRQRLVQAGVRSLLLIAIACALGRPVIGTSSSRHSIVYVVDVSHSIASLAIEEAATTIEDLNAKLRPAHTQIVAFGRTAAVLRDVAALRELAKLEDSDESAGSPVDRGGTDLESALDVARAELAPGYVPRIVLFSDGEPTAGDTSAAVARLAADRIPVFVEPLSVRTLGDTWVDALDVPNRIGAGESFRATVTVGSQRDATATVEVRAAGTVLATRRIDVTTGLTPVVLDVAVPTSGAHVLQAAVAVQNDPLKVNNALDQGIWAAARARVLYVEGAPASAHYLQKALTDSGFDVTVQPPSALPATADELDAWDVAVLSDVPRTAVTEPAMTALADWVERKGGGLLFAGGEAVFGEGGYRETPIERIAPVTFERRDEPQVALIIVLDHSWSMSGQAMDLCKVAAQAAVDVMTDEQYVGILTFNDQFNWDVPLRNVGKNRDGIRAKISAIEAAGHTLIFPAVEQAYFALRTAKARAKHVILLSDGRSYPDDYKGLVEKMVAAHITVSSVAVGPAADNELLDDIAKWGKGRSYSALDPKDVPQIFVKEAKNAMTPGFDEKGITAIVKAPGFLPSVDLTKLPALKGKTVTVIKDNALQVITSDNDDPILAFWPAGLGRTALFASDVKDRWAANWVTWPGYGPFFSSVVRAVQRQRPPALALNVAPGFTRGQARTVRISVEARNADGGYQNRLAPVVQVQEGNSAAAAVPLRQVAPGRYETSVIADASKTLTVSTTGDAAASRVIVPDPAAEYRFRPIDDERLRSIALSTGGAWKPTVETLSNRTGDTRTERRPLWPALLALALSLWFVDLVFRRVRVFEPKAAE
jgi:Ca-activated chloride channel family protein